jgi:hypothetical protein
MTIDVSLEAQSPVLAVSPDTLLLVSGTTVLVYNRGTDSLHFQIDTNLVSRAECFGRCFEVTPDSGTVRRGLSSGVRIDSVRQFQTPIPLTIQSLTGTVVIVLRTQ